MNAKALPLPPQQMLTKPCWHVQASLASCTDRGSSGNLGRTMLEGLASDAQPDDQWASSIKTSSINAALQNSASARLKLMQQLQLPVETGHQQL